MTDHTAPTTTGDATTGGRDMPTGGPVSDASTTGTSGTSVYGDGPTVRPAIDPDAGAAADIASEHDDVSVDAGGRSGPEGAAEPESPEGYGGMDTPGDAPDEV